LLDYQSITIDSLGKTVRGSCDDTPAPSGFEPGHAEPLGQLQLAARRRHWPVVQEHTHCWQQIIKHKHTAQLLLAARRRCWPVVHEHTHNVTPCQQQITDRKHTTQLASASSGVLKGNREQGKIFPAYNSQSVFWLQKSPEQDSQPYQLHLLAR